MILYIEHRGRTTSVHFCGHFCRTWYMAAAANALWPVGCYRWMLYISCSNKQASFCRSFAFAFAAPYMRAEGYRRREDLPSIFLNRQIGSARELLVEILLVDLVDLFPDAVDGRRSGRSGRMLLFATYTRFMAPRLLARHRRRPNGRIFLYMGGTGKWLRCKRHRSSLFGMLWAISASRRFWWRLASPHRAVADGDVCSRTYRRPRPTYTENVHLLSSTHHISRDMASRPSAVESCRSMMMLMAGRGGGGGWSVNGGRGMVLSAVPITCSTHGRKLLFKLSSGRRVTFCCLLPLPFVALRAACAPVPFASAAALRAYIDVQIFSTYIFPSDHSSSSIFYDRRFSARSFASFLIIVDLIFIH